MEEGTGISLYILVGSILFGLFAVMATTFGTDLQAQTSNIVECVQSYVFNEPTDCGDSDSEDLGDSITNNDIRFGPSNGTEWEALTWQEREAIISNYLTTLTKVYPSLKGTDFYKHVNVGLDHSHNDGGIYGVFNDSGDLVKVYTYGHTHEDKRTGSKEIKVNDVRLIPDDFIQKATKTDHPSHTQYRLVNEQGYIELYYVLNT